MGFPRLDPSKKAELILSLTHCLNGKPQTQQDGYVVSLSNWWIILMVIFSSISVIHICAVSFPVWHSFPCIEQFSD